ncbi:hypothetical protein AB733_21580 [Photobacterium swingsii]|uniref:Uncharacterized protein n=1 Tax=Photobacterium swingsii TaxID=680026 RepID=A0A0J8V5V7_9GAMM|nr:hypothetical protein [Photobacterium swingsii]KMV28823.1 hypothetical protein AB733_21580 [Photobacterium swingsii]PSW24550.1 hypothetical protein C9I94_10970 [Photobacterium swingsii]
MKFEHIKKGDQVFISIAVSLAGMTRGRTMGTFFIPVTVTSTTAKFFDCETNLDIKSTIRFRKSDGKEHRAGYNIFTAHIEGEKVNVHGESLTVRDQSEEHDIALKLAKKIGQASTLISLDNSERMINWVSVTEEQCDAIISLVNSLPTKDRWCR